MSLELWSTVDRYLADLLAPHDEALAAALESSGAAGLPPINVAPVQGQLLHLLARSIGAQCILEIGTLGGYSTIWLARALPPGGRLTTIEIDPARAELARANIARAGLSDVVDLQIGPALDVLPQLAAEESGPFDLTFIDADKVSCADYFAWALRLSRVGSLIIVDNVIRAGKVLDDASTDENVQGVRRLLAALSAESRVTATALQTVGSKGHDGWAIALVTAPAG